MIKRQRSWILLFLFLFSNVSCAGLHSTRDSSALSPSPAQPTPQIVAQSQEGSPARTEKRVNPPQPVTTPETGSTPVPPPPPAVSPTPVPPPPGAVSGPSSPAAPGAPSVAPSPTPLPTAPAPAGPLAQAPLPPAPVTPTTPIRPVSPGAPGSPARGKAQGFVFNFDNADLYEVIRTIAEVLKISYVIDPRVKGVVNIHVTGPVAQEDIYPIFLSILRMNGATVVRKDSLYEIVPFGEGKRLPAPTDLRIPAEDRFSIEVIKPRFVPIGELEKVIKPFLSDEKEIIPFPQNNVLIVSDLASNIRKIRDIISLFDIDIFTDMTIRIFPVSNSDAKELAADLEKIFSSFGISSKEAKGGGITFTPIVRANAILVVTSIPGVLDKVENWIKELDKAPTEESRPGVHIYYVQNAKAKDLADVLKEVYAKGKETAKPKAEEPKPAPTTPRTPAQRAAEAAKPAPTPSTRTPAYRGDEAGKTAEGEINIVVDEQNNALVVRAIYRDYKACLETIKKLDIYPKQVLIEVMLAQITLNDATRYGIEFLKFADTFAKGQFQQRGDIGTQSTLSTASAITELSGFGFRYSVVEAAGRFAAAIKAAADDSRLNVISSPHLIASNNKEAKIQIGQEQPILTTTYTTGLTADTGTGLSNVISGNIEYKDVGIIVTLTPRISDSGLVTLEIQVEKSNVDLRNLGSLSNVPVFDKTTAKTTVSVLEGQTIVLGGLIDESKNVTRQGIPFLYKIPIIGALFGTHDFQTRKQELIILMTPHIISDASQSRSVTEEFRQKVRGLKKDFEELERRKTQ